jgi:hypothetical protein
MSKKRSTYSCFFTGALNREGLRSMWRLSAFLGLLSEESPDIFNQLVKAF